MKKGTLMVMWSVFMILAFTATAGAQTPQAIKKRIKQINANVNAELREEGMIPTTPSGKIPYEYLSLLDHVSPVSKSKLKFDQTLVFKFRYPVSDFVYKGNYLMQLYKIGYLGNTSLKTVISETDQNFRKIRGSLPYAINQQGLFNFVYCTYSRPDPSAILVNIYGNKTRTLALNDTIAYYNSHLRSLAIQYNKHEPKDIFVKANTSGISYTTHDFSRFSYSRPVPFETLFLKRNGKLYLIMLSVKNPKVDLQPGMLLNILEGRDVD